MPRKHKNAESLLADAANGLQDKMNEGKRPNLIISQNRMHTINEYVLVFINNFNKIIHNYKLKGSEIKVILKILEYMRFGNLISLSNSTIAKDLEMDKGNVSRIMKRLKETELIVDYNGSLYFNPHIACKGGFDERISEDSLLLDYSAVVLGEYNSEASPSICTPNIRKKLRDDTKECENKEVKEKIDEFFK